MMKKTSRRKVTWNGGSRPVEKYHPFLKSFISPAEEDKLVPGSLWVVQHTLAEFGFHMYDSDPFVKRHEIPYAASARPGEPVVAPVGTMALYLGTTRVYEKSNRDDPAVMSVNRHVFLADCRRFMILDLYSLVKV
jgi:hypothetical protein